MQALSGAKIPWEFPFSPLDGHPRRLRLQRLTFLVRRKWRIKDRRSERRETAGQSSKPQLLSEVRGAVGDGEVLVRAAFALLCIVSVVLNIGSEGGRARKISVICPRLPQYDNERWGGEKRAKILFLRKGVLLKTGKLELKAQGNTSHWR